MNDTTETEREQFDDIEPTDTVNWDGDRYTVEDKGTHLCDVKGEHLLLDPASDDGQMDGPHTIHERLIKLWMTEDRYTFEVCGEDAQEVAA